MKFDVQYTNLIFDFIVLRLYLMISVIRQLIFSFVFFF